MTQDYLNTEKLRSKWFLSNFIGDFDARHQMYTRCLDLWSEGAPDVAHMPVRKILVSHLRTERSVIGWFCLSWCIGREREVVWRAHYYGSLYVRLSMYVCLPDTKLWV